MEIEPQLTTIQPLPANNTTLQETEDIEQRNIESSDTTNAPTQQTIEPEVTSELSNAALNLSANANPPVSRTIETQQQAEQRVNTFIESIGTEPSAVEQAQTREVDSDLVTGVLV